MLLRRALQACVRADLDQAHSVVMQLWRMGYAPEDIMAILFRVCKTLDAPEELRLAFIRELGITHMRLADGLATPLQLAGLLARLCALVSETHSDM